MKTFYGAPASWLNIAASFVAFGIGMIIIGRGGSGTDATVVGAPLLTLSEALKLIIGMCLIAQATALSGVLGRSGPRAIGIVAGLAMLTAGAIGLATIWLPMAGNWGSVVNLIALCGVAATGLWAALSAFWGLRCKDLPTWLCVVGFLLAIPSLAAPFLPPIALAAFVFGIIWNFGVGLRLSHTA